MARFRRSELVLLVATTLGVFALGALYGILLAVALSLGDLLRRVARPHDGILGLRARAWRACTTSTTSPTPQQVPGLVVYRYDSPLFFANAEDFHHRALAAVDEAAHPVEWLLINAEANVEVDLTALDALAGLRRELEARGVVLALARVKQDLLDDLAAAGPRRRHRHRPDVRDAADRRRRLPRLVRRAARAPAPVRPGAPGAAARPHYRRRVLTVATAE